jgi:hypothetical protein
MDDRDFDENEEEEEEEPNKIWRVNEKIKDLVRARKGKVPTGMVTAVNEGKCDIKYDDGTTQAGVMVDQLRSVEKPQKDGTGFISTGNYNEYDFTKSSLPTGVEDST